MLKLLLVCCGRMDFQKQPNKLSRILQIENKFRHWNYFSYGVNPVYTLSNWYEAFSPEILGRRAKTVLRTEVWLEVL